MKLTILYPDMRVHRTGCRDIEKDARHLSRDTIVEAEGATVESILVAELAPDLADMGYTVDDYNLAPCVKETK